MKTRYLIYLVALCFFTASFKADSWELVWSEEGQCSVMMPGEPTYEKMEVPTESGPFDLHMYMLDLSSEEGTDNLVYALMYTPLPEEIRAEKGKPDAETKQRMDNGRNQAISNVNGKLIREKDIYYKGYPGREFEIDYQEGMAVIKVRMYFIENKLYQLQVITLTENIRNRSIDRFMRSFKIKDL